MNNDIKNSFKESFLHEPSGDFTNTVEQKITLLKKTPEPEKSSNIMLFVVLFFILGLPLGVVFWAAVTEMQLPEFTPLSTDTFASSWMNGISQILTDFLPYLIYLLVFLGVYFIGRLVQSRNISVRV